MTKRFNGRFLPPGNEEPSNDPDKDFPISETIYDHSGSPRRFTIEFRHVGLGYSLTARENTGAEIGYEFSSFDATSPYLALGALRAKMHRALATRHLVPSEHGLTMLHDRLIGRIEFAKEAEGHVFVVDGIPLSLEDIGRFAATHEGWQFSLRFVDPSGDLP